MSDSGVSQTDHITNIPEPIFNLTAIPDSYVRLYFTPTGGGMPEVRAVGQLTPALNPVTFPIRPSSPVAHGTYDVTFTVAADSMSTESAHSPSIQVTIDTMAPRIDEVKARNGTTAFSIPAVASSDAQVRPVTLVGGVDNIQVLFDEDVLAPAGSVRLAGVFGGTNTEYSLSVSPGTSTSTIMTATIGGSAIKLDQLWLMLESGVSDITDAAGNPLDGEWTNPTGFGDISGNDTYPSGDGIAGGNFAFKILVLEDGTLIGDTNDDGRVDLDDLNDVRNNFGAMGPADGSLPGDAFVYDGMVNIDDLNSVRNNFGKNVADWPSETPPPPPGAFAMTTPLVTSTGEERLRQALADLYFDRISRRDSSRELDDLFGWKELGDARWWNDLLGRGWKSKL